MRQDQDIEDVLGWVYRDQLADVILDRGVGLWPAERKADGVVWCGHSADGVYAVERQARLGTRIDAAGPQGSVHIHPNAVLVHRAVRGLGSLLADLVIQHAKSGTRSDWFPNARFHYEPMWLKGPRYGPRTGRPARRSFVVVRQRDRSMRVVVSYCPVVPVDHPAEVDERRMIYRD